jgi:hypothetical protein
MLHMTFSLQFLSRCHLSIAKRKPSSKVRRAEPRAKSELPKRKRDLTTLNIREKLKSGENHAYGHVPERIRLGDMY